MYDTKTKNKSFLEVSELLEKQGVKNNKFMLQLYDSGLRGVDPYMIRKNETNEIKARIYAEICRNEWYFLREVVRIDIHGGYEQFKLNIMNCASLYALQNGINKIMICSPRQSERTATVQLDLLWKELFNKTNYSAIVSDMNINNAIMSGKFLVDTLNLLPSWLVQLANPSNGIYRFENKKINTNTIKYIATPGQDETAERVFSKTNPSEVIFTDYPFSKKFDIVFKNLIPVATANNTQIVLESCAKSLTCKNGEFADENRKYIASLLLNSVKFKFLMFDLVGNKLKKYITENSINDILYIKYSWQELGYSEDWYENMKKVLNNNDEIIRNEIELNWGL